MGTAIVVIILVVIGIFALKSSLKHFRGEGGCCGGGSDAKLKKIKPVKITNVVARKKLSISGMSCDKCVTRVSNALNSLEMVSAKVKLDENMAYVDLGMDIDDEVLVEAVAKEGYQVTNIINY